MKSRLLALSGLIALLGTTATFGVLAQTGTPVPGAGNHRVMHNPNLHKARRALERSVDFLQKADHDSQGHREKALDLAQQAIREVDLAIRDDK